MAQSAPSIVFGSAAIASYSTETVQDMLEILEKHKIAQIDTASIYVSFATSEGVGGEA
jgi:aflatoxin B1 aldehyde reductase